MRKGRLSEHEQRRSFTWRQWRHCNQPASGHQHIRCGNEAHAKDSPPPLPLLKLEAKGSPPQEPTKAPTLLFPYPSTIPLTVHLRIHCEPADGGERRTGRRVSQPERARAHPWPRRGTYCLRRCRADTSVTNVDVPLVLLMAMYRC